MNVAIVIPSLDPRRGGAEQWTFQFVQRLLADGHQVHVVARELGPAARELPLVLHQVPVRSLGRWHAPWAFATAADEVVRRLSVDVVHDMGYGWSGDVFQPHGGTRAGSLRQNLLLAAPGMRRARRFAVKVLPRYRVQKRIEARQYARREKRIFIALSQMVRRDMRGFHNVPDEHLRVIYNGVDVERFRPENRQQWREPVRKRFGLSEDVVLLIVAHNFRLKGLETVVRAVGRLVREGRAVRLLVVGKGRAGHYQRMAHQSGCAQRVHFVGETDDASAFYAAADAYVQPTFYDPCSLVVLEALAAGLPVVTSRYNGAGELIREGREGSIVQDPGDADELAARLRPLLDGATRAAMGDAARQLAMEHTLERNYREVLSVYDEVLPHRAAAGPHRAAATLRRRRPWAERL